MRHAKTPPVTSPAAAEPAKTGRRDKATHSGTCQVCGALQKLPAGVLSQHGYTRKWGFFNGVCNGAGYKPFEVSFDRVQLAVDWARGDVARLQGLIADLRIAPVMDKAPFYTYDRNGRAGYYEVEVTVTLEKNPPHPTNPNISYDAIVLTEIGGRNDGKRHYGNQYGLFRSVEDSVKKLRESRISRIERGIEERERYIAWQEGRIRNWKPGKLTPVKEAA